LLPPDPLPPNLSEQTDPPTTPGSGHAFQNMGSWFMSVVRTKYIKFIKLRKGREREKRERLLHTFSTQCTAFLGSIVPGGDTRNSKRKEIKIFSY
jgi:hypothetical protein